MWSVWYLPYVNQIWIFSTDFHKCIQDQISQMHPMGATLIYADRYGRMDMTKLIGAFHDGEHLIISAWQM